MSGYNNSRFVNLNKTEIEEFLCGICLGVCKNPVDTKCCRKTYCKLCITNWIKQNNSCPNDRSKLDTTDLTESSKIVLNLLAKLMIKCDYSEYGCTKVVRLDSLEKHTKECRFNKCKNCGDFLGNIVDHNCEQSLKKRITIQNEDIEALNQQIYYLNDINAKLKAVLKNHKLVVCYKCGVEGHLASNCYPTNKICCYCGVKGHPPDICIKSSLVFQSKCKIQEKSSPKSGEELNTICSDVETASNFMEILKQIEEEDDVNKSILSENEVNSITVSDISSTDFTDIIIWIITLVILILTVCYEFL